MEAKISDFHQTRSTLLICQRSISHHKRKLNSLFKKLIASVKVEKFQDALGIEKLNYAKFPAGTKQAVEVLKLVLNQEESLYSQTYGNVKMKSCIFNKQEYNRIDNKNKNNNKNKSKNKNNCNNSSLFNPHSRNCGTCAELRSNGNLYLEMNSTIYAFHEEKLIASHLINDGENTIDGIPSSTAIVGPNGQMYETRIIKMEGDAIKPAKNKRGRRSKDGSKSIKCSNNSVVGGSDSCRSTNESKKKGKKRKLSEKDNYNDRNQRRKLNQGIINGNIDFHDNGTFHVSNIDGSETTPGSMSNINMNSQSQCFSYSESQYDSRSRLNSLESISMDDSMHQTMIRIKQEMTDDQDINSTTSPNINGNINGNTDATNENIGNVCNNNNVPKLPPLHFTNILDNGQDDGEEETQVIQTQVIHSATIDQHPTASLPPAPPPLNSSGDVTANDNLRSNASNNGNTINNENGIVDYSPMTPVRRYIPHGNTAPQPLTPIQHHFDAMSHVSQMSHIPHIPHLPHVSHMGHIPHIPHMPHMANIPPMSHVSNLGAHIGPGQHPAHDTGHHGTNGLEGPIYIVSERRPVMDWFCIPHHQQTLTHPHPHHHPQNQNLNDDHSHYLNNGGDGNQCNSIISNLNNGNINTTNKNTEMVAHSNSPHNVDANVNEKQQDMPPLQADTESRDDNRGPVLQLRSPLNSLTDTPLALQPMHHCHPYPVPAPMQLESRSSNNDNSKTSDCGNFSNASDSRDTHPTIASETPNLNNESTQSDSNSHQIDKVDGILYPRLAILNTKFEHICTVNNKIKNNDSGERNQREIEDILKQCEKLIEQCTQFQLYFSKQLQKIDSSIGNAMYNLPNCGNLPKRLHDLIEKTYDIYFDWKKCTANSVSIIDQASIGTKNTMFDIFNNDMHILDQSCHFNLVKSKSTTLDCNTSGTDFSGTLKEHSKVAL